MPAPQWVTPSGSLGTILEGQQSFVEIKATNAESFKLISGSLPAGLTLSSSGDIIGIPQNVALTTSFQFVVRATNSHGITDRTFSLSVDGADNPTWVTQDTFLPIGPTGELYAVNRQYVEFQFVATTDILPNGQIIKYYIGEFDGELPPGLTLSQDGRLTGIITDNLSLDEQASDSGGYDTGAYSLYPYDYAVSVQGDYVKPDYVNKIYQFYVTATDGVSSSKKLFRIRVEDLQYYFNEVNHPIPPFWLTPSSLGSVRADNHQVIELSVYDPYPANDSVSFDWVSPTVNTDGSPISKPPYFELDQSSGVLYATIPYQPAYNVNYKFTVRVIKTDINTDTSTFRDQTFTLSIQGSSNNNLTFSTAETLENIYAEQQSELSIVALNSNDNVSVRYELVNGALPAGLTLLFDGSIVGKATETGQFSFTVRATDAYRSGTAVRTFTLNVLGSTEFKHTNIYVAPFMNAELRQNFRDFVTDPTIFPPSLLYRKNDPAFGITTAVKVYIEYGIEVVNLNVFADVLRDYFYPKHLYFGAVMSVKATNASGKYTHDTICVEIVDNKSPGPADPITFSDQTVYINNITNLKEQLESAKVCGRDINVDEYQLPSFMRSVQADGHIMGFKPVLILGHVLPGSGYNIVKKIKASQFDFTQIHFEIDRLIVENTLENTGEKYLLFPRPSQQIRNPAEHYSYITDGNDQSELYTEDGFPLFSERTGTTKYSDNNGEFLLQENSGIILTENNEYIELE